LNFLSFDIEKFDFLKIKYSGDFQSPEQKHQTWARYRPALIFLFHNLKQVVADYAS
jgi:hypothetical protein